MYQEDIWEKIAIVCASITLMFITLLAFVMVVAMVIRLWVWLF